MQKFTDFAEEMINISKNFPRLVFPHSVMDANRFSNGSNILPGGKGLVLNMNLS